MGELVAAEDYQDDQDVLHLCIFDQPNGSSTQAIWNPSADKYGYWTDPSQWLYDGGVPGWSEWVQIEGNLMDSSGDDDDDAGVAAMAYLDTEVDVGVLVMHNGGVTITNDSTGILNFVKNEQRHVVQLTRAMSPSFRRFLLPRLHSRRTPRLRFQRTPCPRPLDIAEADDLSLRRSRPRHSRAYTDGDKLYISSDLCAV